MIDFFYTREQNVQKFESILRDASYVILTHQVTNQIADNQCFIFKTSYTYKKILYKQHEKRQFGINFILEFPLQYNKQQNTKTFYLWILINLL
ncbi:hypothetical protein HMPREF2660_09755 [Weeksella sp. HMSC059D05]|nr:hypothetical protein HMPREF2660_09755 [Weeksella sp. HMSC059D05]